MSFTNEKSAAVVASNPVDDRSANPNFLTINRPSPSRQTSGTHLTTIHDVDSTHSLSPPATPNNDEKHLETTYVTPRDDDHMYADLEAQGLTSQKTQASQSGLSALNSKCQSRMDSAWPGRKHVKQQRKMAKLRRSQCGCWAGLSKLYKSLIITAVILAVLGIAMGIGFGLSGKVGGTINDGANGNKHVPTK